MTSDAAVRVEGLVKQFGDVTALDGIDLTVERGQVVGLLGPNGAGKTTLINLLTGVLAPTEGRIELLGHDISHLPSHARVARGMVRTFQLTKALSKMKVIDNMRLGATKQTGERLFSSMLAFTWRSQEKSITVRADELLKRFKLDAKREDFAGELSGGQRKLLEMARALMTDPEMVMLDEPMAGVNPALTQSLLHHIKDLRQQGMTVLFVEHDMDMVRHISDWVIVMAQGKVIAEGPPDSVMSNPQVIDAYLGGHHDRALTESGESLQSGGA